MADPERFARRMHDLSLRVGDNTEKIVRQAVLAADQAVVLATPIDTGRAKGNWIVALESPDRSLLDAPSTPAGGEQRALDQGAEAASQITLDTTEIWISNNLPYIEPLNEGHSPQAAANFVEAAVQAAVEAVREANLLE